MSEDYLCASLCKLAASDPTYAVHENFSEKPLTYDGKKYSNNDIRAYLWFKDALAFLAFHVPSDGIKVTKPTSPLLYRGYTLSDRKVRVNTAMLEKFYTIEHHIYNDIRIYEQTKGLVSLVITGHGWAGSVAHIAAMYYSKNLPNIIISCHTFSAPLVGNKEFAREFEQTVTKKENHYSIDDRIPVIKDYVYTPRVTYIDCLKPGIIKKAAAFFMKENAFVDISVYIKALMS